jgi:PAS domain S-box-containing protein
MVSNGFTNIYLKDPLQSRPFIEGLIAIMREGLLMLDSSNEIDMANNAAVKLFGFSSIDELKGRQFSELFKDSSEAEASLALFNQGSFEDYENMFVRRDGTSFEGSCSGAQICDVTGQTCFKMILLRDITALKVSEKRLAGYTKRLEKNNQTLDQFAYIISHDLKAPLRAISNLSTWIQEDAGPTLSEENRSNLTMLRNRVTRLESMISGVLEYSKIGRVQVPKESVDVYALVQEVVEMLAPPAHIQVEVTDNLPVLETQRIMLVQVFSNLISNAIKYNDKALGIVRVYCSESEGGYQFVVEDNGPGIPSEFFEKIFMIFQTLQSRDKFESTGIGLTIIKRIIEDVNGRIWVESELGKGSKFIFVWPVKDHNNGLIQNG